MRMFRVEGDSWKGMLLLGVVVEMGWEKSAVNSPFMVLTSLPLSIFFLSFHMCGVMCFLTFENS